MAEAMGYGFFIFRFFSTAFGLALFFFTGFFFVFFPDGIRTAVRFGFRDFFFPFTGPRGPAEAGAASSSLPT